MAKKVKVRCPKCGAEFEVSLHVMEVPKGQILLHEVTHQASPEAVRLWEKRKKQPRHLNLKALHTTDSSQTRVDL